MSSRLRVFLPWVVLCVVGAVGSAQNLQSNAFGYDGEIIVSCRSPWPTEVGKGFVPMLVRVENTATEGRTVSLDLVTYSYDATRESVTRTVQVPALAAVEVEMLAKVVAGAGWYGSNSQLDVDCPGGGGTMYGVLGLEDPGAMVYSAIVLSGRRPSEQDLLDWTTALGHPRTATRRSAGGLDVSLAGVVFRDAPRRTEAYTSLDLVVVDAFEAVPPEVLEPVLSWVRLGGTVAFAGDDPLRRAREHPAVAPWLEDRFLLGTRGEVSMWTMGHGRLLLLPTESLFSTSDEVSAVRSVFASEVGLVPQENEPLRTLWPTIPGLGELPYRVLILLLIVFAVVIGPVNFTMVKATGKPALLLVTIPLLALVAVVAVLAYGIFYQGIDVKTASLSHTILDQRTHRAYTAEARTMFAGLSPGPGLLPDPGTMCFPSSMQRSGVETSFRLDLDRGMWAGDYLPVRRVGKQLLLSDDEARARVEVGRDATGLTVTNGLGARIEYLLLRDPAGGFHLLESPLATDGTAPLVASDAQAADANRAAMINRVRRIAGEEDLLLAARSEAPTRSSPFRPWSPTAPHLLELPNNLPLGSYLAVLERNPFADDCGLEAHELVGIHFVQGILDENDEVWR